VHTFHIVNEIWSVHVGAGYAGDLFLIEPCPGIETRFDWPYRFGIA
jgi:hypothetical protein